MKEILFMAWFFGMVQISLAQSFTISDLNALHDLYTLERSLQHSIDPEQYSRISGSPYLSEDFVEGVVIINDTIRFEMVPMRYNIFTGYIEYLDAQERILAVNMSRNNFTFKFNNQQFNLLEYKNRGDKEQGLLELLVDGEIQLYRKYLVEFKEKTNAMGYQDAQPNRFVRRNDIYLLAIENNSPEVIFSRRELLRKLEQANPDIDQYLKNTRIRMRSEESLIGIVEYSNKQTD